MFICLCMSLLFIYIYKYLDNNLLCLSLLPFCNICMCLYVCLNSYTFMSYVFKSVRLCLYKYFSCLDICLSTTVFTFVYTYADLYVLICLFIRVLLYACKFIYVYLYVSSWFHLPRCVFASINAFLYRVGQ